MGLTLYTWTTPNGRKISIMLEELGLPYRVRPVDIGQGEQFATEFLTLSPNNKIPALVDDEAVGGPLAVFESGAILTYLAEKTGHFLAPSGHARYAALEWLHWSIGGLGPMIGQLSFFALKPTGKVTLAIDRFTQEADRLLGVMDRRLYDSVYLGGDDYSIADIAAYPWSFFVSTSLDHVLADSLASKPNLYRWLAATGSRPAVRRGMQVPPADEVPPRKQIDALKRRLALAEEERDALRAAGQEENYLQACSMVEALELQLEAHLRQALT
jgi:GST-like protein